MTAVLSLRQAISLPSGSSPDQTTIGLAILAIALLASLILMIRRVRQHLELTRRVAELASLAEVGLRIARAPLEVYELAETAYQEAARVAATDFFQLGTFDGDTYRTLLWVRDGERQPNQAFRMPPGQEGLVGWVRQTGSPLLVSDFAAERERLPATPSYDAADPPSSAIFVPLLAGDEVLGVMVVQSRRRSAFGDHQLRLLVILANAVASSVALARLRARIEFRTLQLALIKEISRHLTSLRPLPDLFTQVARLISHTLHYPAVRLFEAVGGSLVLRADSSGQSESRTKDAVGGTQAVDQAMEQGQTVLLPARDEGGRPRVERTEGMDASRLAVPLKVEDRVLGVLEIESRDEFPEEHVALAETLAAHLAIAVLEAHNFSQQQEEAWITTVLVEVARHAARPGDAMEALQAVLQLTTLLAGTTWALVLIPDPSDGRLVLGPTSGLRRQILDRLADLHLEPSSLGIQPPYESETPAPISLPAPLVEALGAQNATAVTLSDGTSLLGLLLLEGQEQIGRRLSLLAGIGHQISLRLENTRLVEEAAARRSLEREIAMARGIQESFLPSTLPDPPGWEVGAIWKAAREVGGDFYDFIPLPAGPDGPRWGIAIADVADKGVPAALFMALCRTLLRSVAIHRTDPGKALARLNELILSDTKTDLFVSVLYAIWEPQTGHLSYANAGHNPPLLFKPEVPAVVLKEHGMVLGVSEQVAFNTKTLTIPPGGLLLLYTDGVTEAMDPDGQFFGVPRLEALVLGLEDWNGQHVASQIGSRIPAFTGEPDLSDDLTAVVLHRQSQSAAGAPSSREQQHGV